MDQEQRPPFHTKLPHDLNLDSKPELILDLINKSVGFITADERASLRKSAALYLTTMACGFLGTVCLGLPTSVAPDWFKAAGFVFSAAVTFLNGIEPYFGFRARAIHQREALSAFYRLSDDAAFLFAGEDPQAIPKEKLTKLHNRLKQIWTDLNQKVHTQKASSPGSANAGRGGAS
jgi:hypothetical protein